MARLLSAAVAATTRCSTTTNNNATTCGFVKLLNIRPGPQQRNLRS